MLRHRKDGDVIGDSHFGLDILGDTAQEGAGIIDLGQYASGDSGQFGYIRRPGLVVYVEHLRGRGYGILGLFDAGDPVFQDVGHHEQSLCVFQSRRIVSAGHIQLKQSVDIHALDADSLKHCVSVHLFGIKTVGCSYKGFVPVLTGQKAQLTVRVQQAVIHSPGIDADARNGSTGGLGSLSETDLDLLEKAVEHPFLFAVDDYIVVEEPVGLFYGQPALGELSQKHSAALGPQIHCSKCHSVHQCLSPATLF